MAKIISAVNYKGGPGKTTFACNAAIYFQVVKGARVLIVETDDKDQDSASFWMGNRDEEVRIPVIHIADHATMKREIPSLANAYDYVLIDGLPGSSHERLMLNTSIIKVSDLVIVPVEPSPLDAHRALGTIQLIQMCQEATGGKPVARALINGIDVRANGHDLVREKIEESGMPVLNNMLKALQVVKMSPGIGTGLVEEKGQGRDMFMAVMEEVEAL